VELRAKNMINKEITVVLYFQLVSSKKKLEVIKNSAIHRQQIFQPKINPELMIQLFGS